MAPSMNDSFPARLILSADDAPLYLEWQKTNYPSDTPGHIQYAFQYSEFLRHKGTKAKVSKAAGEPPTPMKAKSTSNVAAQCGHELHPSDILVAGYCPVCEVRMRLNFLDATAKAIQEAGGPWYDMSRGPPRKTYAILRRAWHLARLQLQEVLEVIKVEAAYEMKWETEHPDEVNETQKSYTSTKAVSLAQMECRYPAALSGMEASEKTRNTSSDEKQFTSSEEKPKVCKKSILKSKPSKPQTKKKVTFALFTKFDVGRPSATYHRPSHCYQPGPHACLWPNEWLNTSRLGSIPTDILNLKLFVTTSQADFYELNEDNYLRPGQMQGLVGLHPGAQVISDFTQSFQDQMEGGTEQLIALVCDADAMVVLVDGDMVLDVFLGHSEHVEEMDYEEDVVDQSRWTCLREVIDTVEADVDD